MFGLFRTLLAGMSERYALPLLHKIRNFGTLKDYHVQHPETTPVARAEETQTATAEAKAAPKPQVTTAPRHKVAVPGMNAVPRPHNM